MRDVPGIESLTLNLTGGQQVFTLNNRQIVFGAGDSDTTVEAGIRAAVAAPAIVSMAAGAPVSAADAANAAAVLHPSVSAQLLPTPSPVQQGTTPVTATSAPAASTPAAHALTIRDALSGHAAKMDAILQAQVALLNATLDDQLTSVQTGTTAVISKVKSHTDEFKAILGQFQNDL